MKKKKRDPLNQPESSAFPLPAEPEAEVAGLAVDGDLESQSDLADEPSFDLAPNSLPVDDVDPALLEPMDELFNEMLAHDTGLATMEEASQLALPEPFGQPDAALSAEEPAAGPDQFILLESLDEAADTSQQVDSPEAIFALEDMTPEEPESMTEIAFNEQLAGPLETGDDRISSLLDAMPVPEPMPEPVDQEAAPLEIPPEPLAPQPPLEAVVGSIDRALEAAPAVVSRTEPSSQHHHQKQFSQLDDYVVFSLAGGDYAVSVRDVAEIGRVPAITRVPNVPEFVRGITNLRGEVVPVLNLPALLGLMESQVTARGRVLFLQTRAEISATGLLVDEVKGIQRIQSQQLEQVTGLVDDKVTSVLRGVYGRGDRLLNVLDLEQLFRLQELRQLEAV